MNRIKLLLIAVLLAITTSAYGTEGRTWGEVKDSSTSQVLTVPVDITHSSSEIYPEGCVAKVGAYSMFGIAGTYSVTFSAQGYENNTVSVTFTSGVSQQDITLTPSTPSEDFPLNLNNTVLQ